MKSKLTLYNTGAWKKVTLLHKDNSAFKNVFQNQQNCSNEVKTKHQCRERINLTHAGNVAQFLSIYNSRFSKTVKH